VTETYITAAGRRAIMVRLTLDARQLQEGLAEVQRSIHRAFRATRYLADTLTWIAPDPPTWRWPGRRDLIDWQVPVEWDAVPRLRQTLGDDNG